MRKRKQEHRTRKCKTNKERERGSNVTWIKEEETHKHTKQPQNWGGNRNK